MLATDNKHFYLIIGIVRLKKKALIMSVTHYQLCRRALKQHGLEEICSLVHLFS